MTPEARAAAWAALLEEGARAARRLEWKMRTAGREAEAVVLAERAAHLIAEARRTRGTQPA